MRVLVSYQSQVKAIKSRIVAGDRESGSIESPAAARWVRTALEMI